MQLDATRPKTPVTMTYQPGDRKSSYVSSATGYYQNQFHSKSSRVFG